MDPFSIIAAIAGIGDVSFRVARSLYEFGHNVKGIDRTVLDLAAEVQTFASTCSSVQTQLQELVQQYEDKDVGGANELWSLTQKTLDQCQKTIEQLDRTLDGVRNESGSVLGQALRQVKLNMSNNDIVEARSLVRSHTTSLQISLQVINITVSHLAPKQADQALLSKLDALQQSVDTLLGHQDEMQGIDRIASSKALLQRADEVLSSGATLYDASIAGGSMIGDQTSLLRQKRKKEIPEWIRKVQGLQVKQDTQETNSSGSEDPRLPHGPSSKPIGISTHTEQSDAFEELNRDATWMSPHAPIRPHAYLAQEKFDPDALLDHLEASTTTQGSSTHSTSEQASLLTSLTSMTQSNNPSKKERHYNEITGDLHEPQDTLNQADEAIEWDVEHEISVAKQSLQMGENAFLSRDYQTAYDLFRAAAELIGEIPPAQRKFYSRHHMQFKIAVCFFHLFNAQKAEAALVLFLERPVVSTKEDSLLLCDAGHLLSQTYIRLGKLDLALSTGQGSARGRWKLLGDKDHKYFESLGLLSRIYRLQNNAKRSRVYAAMVPASLQTKYVEKYAALAPETSRNRDKKDVKVDQNRKMLMQQSDNAKTLAKEGSSADRLSSTGDPVVSVSALASTEAIRSTTPSSAPTKIASAEPGISINRKLVSLDDQSQSKDGLAPPASTSSTKHGSATNSSAGAANSISTSFSSSMGKIFRDTMDIAIGTPSAKIKVKDVTNDDPSHASIAELSEVAALTYKSSPAAYKVMSTLSKRLDDPARTTRQVHKSLRVVHYLLYEGANICVSWLQNKISMFKPFLEYECEDQYSKDRIRILAKSIESLLQNSNVLRADRNRSFGKRFPTT